MILLIFNNDTVYGNNESNGTAESCLSDHYQDDFGHNEIILIISLILLSLWEIMQMIRLGKLYFNVGIGNYLMRDTE